MKRGVTFFQLATAAIVVVAVLTAARPTPRRMPIKTMTFDEICSSFAPGCFAGSGNVLVGRGTNNVITIKGAFIDNASMADISANGQGATVTSIKAHYPCSVGGKSIGCLELNLNVPPTAGVGQLVTITVGGIFGGTVNAITRRRGLITGITQPNGPGAWGQPVDVVVTGTDIGNAEIRMTNHTISNLVSTDTRLSFTARATGTNPVQRFGFAVKDRNFTMPDYRPYQEVVYAPYTGVACASVPNIAAPQLGAPANGTVMSFASPTSPTNVTVNFGWQNAGDPQNKYLLSITGNSLTNTRTLTSPTKSSGTITATLTPLFSTVDTVISSNINNSSTFTKTLARNRSYSWKVRAWNCGQTAPYSASSSFTVQ